MMMGLVIFLLLLVLILAIVCLAGWKCPGASRRFCLRLWSVCTRRRPIHSAVLQMRRIDELPIAEMKAVDEDEEILDPTAPAPARSGSMRGSSRLRPLRQWRRSGHMRLQDQPSSGLIGDDDEVDLEVGSLGPDDVTVGYDDGTSLGQEEDAGAAVVMHGRDAGKEHVAIAGVVHTDEAEVAYSDDAGVLYAHNSSITHAEHAGRVKTGDPRLQQHDLRQADFPQDALQQEDFSEVDLPQDDDGGIAPSHGGGIVDVVGDSTIDSAGVGGVRDTGAAEVEIFDDVPFGAPLESPIGMRAAWALHEKVTREKRVLNPTSEQVASAFASIKGRTFQSLGIENFDSLAKARGWSWAQKKILSSKGGKVKVDVEGMKVKLAVAFGPVNKVVELDCGGQPKVADVPFRVIIMTTGLALRPSCALQINYVYSSAKAKAKGEILFKVVSTLEYETDRLIWNEWTILPPGKGQEPVFSRTTYKLL